MNKLLCQSEALSKMKEFKENSCRLCKKVFCCKKCREKHEKEIHHIHLDCEICIYGKTLLLLTSTSLIEHIKTVHWPLHCLVCKRLFGSVDDLFQHSKCPLSSRITKDLEKSPYSPGNTKLAEQFYDSPPLLSCIYEKGQSKNLRINSNLATSTPMQKEDNHLLEKIQQVIVTPVDSGSVNMESLSVIKKNQENDTGSLKKRRVTFGETTEHTDTPYRPKNTTTNANNINSCGETCSIISDDSAGHFYSAKEEQSSQFDTQQKENVEVYPNPSSNIPTIHVTESPQIKDTKEIPTVDEESICNEETIWTSAINKSASVIEETGNTSWEPSTTPESNQFATPMLPNHKKKKVNIVMPTPVKIKEEICIKFLGPMQISSTPNSSTIPVESAPNHRDIFRSEESIPSTSKSEMDISECIPSKNQHQTRVSSESRESFKQITGETTRPLCCSSSSADNSLHGRLWSSVSRIVKNVTCALNGFSSVDGVPVTNPLSLKRHFSDYDYLEEPRVKRYKLTEIKCRRTIRDIPVTYYTREMHSIERREIHINIEKEENVASNTKLFVDKATQTDEVVLMD